MPKLPLRPLLECRHATGAGAHTGGERGQVQKVLPEKSVDGRRTHHHRGQGGEWRRRWRRRREATKRQEPAEEAAATEEGDCTPF